MSARSSAGLRPPACACSTSRCFAWRRKRGSEDWEAVFGAAQRLGATDLLAHGDDPVPQRLAHALGELCELAARYGLRVNLEPMPWVEISTVTRAKRLIAESGVDNAAVLIDAIHFSAQTIATKTSRRH